MRLLILASILSGLMCGSGAWLANGWRLGESHQVEMREAEKTIADLRAAIASQSASIQANAAAAAESRRVASIAQDQANRARSELKRAKAAPTCQEGARQLWDSVQ